MALTTKYRYQGTCKNCGSLFTSNSKSTVYCTKQCFGLAIRTTDRNHVCPYCESKFQSKFSHQKYCSYRCSRSRKGARARTNPASQAYAQEIGCVVCGEMRETDAAHITAHCDGGSSYIENIVPLCPTHHRCFDKEQLTEREKEFLFAFLTTKFFQHAIAGTLEKNTMRYV